MIENVSPERWRRISALFDEALELPPERRGAFLDETCAEDADLRRRVAEMLDAAERSAGLLDQPAMAHAGSLLRQVAQEPPPTETMQRAGSPEETAAAIGPYRPLEKVGEGGMGEVWLAEQTEPIRRTVALKLIKAGMDTKQFVARFEAERQALALMDHPGIAKVFDAGETSRGLPFFVMEYVKGEPITAYCDRQRLTTRERLELFTQVCEGVQHAHQKGIIHRDLKPSNVLVTVQGEKPLPKIIDFGVAKATAQRLTEKTMYTELGVLIGTPEYMSPEQAEMTGLDVDTRTDVYALGVILYELLTGALPFDPKDFRTGGFDEIRRKIREVDPPRPSTRVSAQGEASTESARRRRTDPGKLVSRLKGDLDWITMRALEKDRTRRYASPNELAADIGRHLRDQPVLAGPPSVVYRARKFIRRHRLGTAAAAVVLLAFVAGIVGTTIGLVRARRAEAAARTEQERSEKIATFLSKTLSDVDPIGMGKTLRTNLLQQLATRESPSSLGDVNMVDVARRLVDAEILHKAVERIETELKEEPALATELYHTIGSAYHNLQLYQPAGDIFARAAELSERTRGAEDERTLHLKRILADARKRAGRYREAEALYLEVVETGRRTGREEARETLVAMDSLGDTYRFQGREDEAEPMLRKALETMRRALGEEDEDTLQASNNLALVLRDQGHHPEAEMLLNDTAEKMGRVLGNEDQVTLNVRKNLTDVLRLSGRLEEAEKLLLELLETSRRIQGDENWLTLTIRRNLADVYLAQKRYAETEALVRDNIQKMLRAWGEENPETFGQIYALATVLTARGRIAEAVPFFLEALGGYRRMLGERHFKTFAVSSALAAAYEQLGRRAEAEEIYLATVRSLRGGRQTALNSVYANAAYHLACLSAARGDRSKAMEWLKTSVDAGLTAPDLDAFVARACRN